MRDDVGRGGDKPTPAEIAAIISKFECELEAVREKKAAIVNEETVLENAIKMLWTAYEASKRGD